MPRIAGRIYSNVIINHTICSTMWLIGRDIVQPDMHNVAESLG